MNEKLIWLFSVACISLSSCCSEDHLVGKEPERHAIVTEHAVKPEAAVLNWLRALETENRALFRANSVIFTEHEDYVEVNTDYLFSLVAFRRDMTDAYGPDSVESIDPLFPRAIDVAETLTVEQSGDSAIVRGAGCPFPVTREGGIWRVALPLHGLDPEQKALEMQLYKAMNMAIAHVRPMIGRPGVTADKVREMVRRYVNGVYASESKRGQSPE